MKTEKEIRDEIEATKRTKDNYRKAYTNGKISRLEWIDYIHDCTATIDALSWVLGENDRYD